MMKKIIALALALSMALSMVAFAGYTDAAQVNSDLTGAVELVGALGIMTGNPDGSFNPTGTLTRGEAAVIVYRLSAGKSDIDPSWGDASLNTFTDMDHWSAPYVNYCAALGLIAGYPDGTFRPEAPVTAVEMAKMLLNAAGYDTEKQGYGKNWPAAVLADATNSGLFADYEAAYTAAASREWVAKMVANLMDISTVSYNMYTDKLMKDEVTFGTEKYDLATLTGVVTATDTYALDGASPAASGKATVGSDTIKYDLPNSMLNHRVKVYYKNADGSKNVTADPANNIEASRAYTDGEKVYAVVDKSTVKITTLDKLTADTDDDGNKYLYVDGVKTSTLLVMASTNTSTQSVMGNTYVDYVVDHTRKAVDVLTDEPFADSREVILISNDSDSAYDAIMMSTVKFGKVGAIDTEKKTATVSIDNVDKTVAEKNADFKWESVNFVDEIAKDDIVRIESVINAKGEMTYEVSKVNAVRTKATSSTASTFTAGGVEYKAAFAGSELNVANFNLASFISTNLSTKDLLKDTTVDVYTDGKYVVYATVYGGETLSGLSANIVYVIAGTQGKENNSVFVNDEPAKVQVMFADGTVAIYEYDAGESEDAATLTYNASTGALNETGVICEYVMNDDGSMYFKKTMTANGDANIVSASGEFTYTAKATASESFLKVSQGTLFANDNTVFFVKYKTTEGADKYTVLKASEIEAKAVVTDWNLADKLAYTENSTTKEKTLAYAVITSSATKLPAPSNVTKGDFFLALEAGSLVVTTEGNTWAVKGINAAGEAQTLTVTKNGGNVVAGTLYQIKTSGTDVELVDYLVDGENFITSATTASTDLTTEAAAGKWYAAKITSTDGSTFVTVNDLNGAKLTLADDLAVIAVKKTTSPESYAQGTGKVAVADVYVAIRLNADGEVATIITGSVRADKNADYTAENAFAVFKR